MSNLERKGIILAGGRGTRLYPSTKVLSKQLLPIYDKPMIYYPLSTLMSANIREILLISTDKDILHFQELLKDGSQWGINIKYEIQNAPNGIAEAFIIGKKFIKNNPCVLILGDNIFYGKSLENLLQKTSKSKSCTIFACKVKKPERYGVVSFDKNKAALSIEEKPVKPLSNYAVTGLYFFDKHVVDIAENLKPSNRNELEITDINNIYLNNKKLKVEILERDTTWIDTGTYDSFLNGANFVSKEQKKNKSIIACLEEIALKKRWINKNTIKILINDYGENPYSEYLTKIYNKIKNDI